MKQSLIPTISGRKGGPYYSSSSTASMASTASFSDLSEVVTRSKGYSRHDEEVDVVSGRSDRRRCTSREGALVAAVLALLLLAGVLIALVATFSNPCRHHTGPGCEPTDGKSSELTAPEEKPCLSSSCVGLASRVVSSLNQQVAPCDDFFQFACGGFGEGRLLPVTSGVVDAYAIASRNNLHRVREILEEPGYTVDGKVSSAVHKAKTYYTSCLNVHISDKRGRLSALKLIHDLGSWPLTSDSVSGHFDPTTFDLEDRLSRAFRYQAFPLMLIQVEPDIFGNHEGKELLQFGPGSLGLESISDMTKADSSHEHQVFVNFFTTVTSSLGADPGVVAEVAEQMWRLNEAIARITPSNILNNLDRPTIEEFSAQHRRYIDVGKLLRLTFGADMPETEQILVLGKDYFSYLGTVLAQADKGLLATYINWQTLITMAPYLGATIRNAEEEAQVDLYGYTPHPPPRWEMCARRTTDLFPSVVDALFVEKFYSHIAKEEGEAIMDFIQEELMRQLPSIPWIDNTTLEEAENKLQGLTRKVGYANLVTNHTALEEAWAHISPLSDDDELYNLGIVRQANYRKSFLDRSNNKNSTWRDKTATETLGAYDRFTNQLLFTAGMFQYPFFEKEFPRAMKFGAMGTVIAEEALHALDNQGRYHDADGRYRDWWSPQVVKAFENRTKCFRDASQDFNSQVDTLDLTEKLVSDSGALRLAHNVYEVFVTETANRETHTILPAVNLTEPQLFYLSYAQRFCVKDHGLPLAGGGSAEATNRFRVILSLQNSEDFSKAFQCPAGSSMNPENKCSLW